MDVYIGFDSAWTDSTSAPGAICAVEMLEGKPTRFHPPVLAAFEEARQFIESIRSRGVTLIALDQPTLVPNLIGMRPVERVAASLVSWLGGGVQPANRGRRGMFCDESPIWRFLSALGAMEDPEAARHAEAGLYLMEVFPALALASLGNGFFGRLAGPRYNPARRKTFRLEHWTAVCAAARQEAHELKLAELAQWCSTSCRNLSPVKADQDRLDAVLCLLIAMKWRLRPRHESLMLGDRTSGYMVFPASASVRRYLEEPARRHGVAIDGSRQGPTPGRLSV